MAPRPTRSLAQALGAPRPSTGRHSQLRERLAFVAQRRRLQAEAGDADRGLLGRVLARLEQTEQAARRSVACVVARG